MAVVAQVAAVLTNVVVETSVDDGVVVRGPVVAAVDGAVVPQLDVIAPDGTVGLAIGALIAAQLVAVRADRRRVVGGAGVSERLAVGAHLAIRRPVRTAIRVAQSAVLAEQGIVAPIDDAITVELRVPICIAAFVLPQLASVVAQVARARRAIGRGERNAGQLRDGAGRSGAGCERGDGEELGEAHRTSDERGTHRARSRIARA